MLRPTTIAFKMCDMAKIVADSDQSSYITLLSLLASNALELAETPACEYLIISQLEKTLSEILKR